MMNFSKASWLFALFILGLIAIAFSDMSEENESNNGINTIVEDSDVEPEDVPEGKVDYAKGSVCGYCTYCKFCKLCDVDCPCQTSASKPNCKMCKYCKYCHLCSAVCDTICTPGGVLDRVSAGIVNALPSVNEKEVASDIQSVKTWIDRSKDEL